MTISARRCAESAMKFGADSYSIWTPNDLSPEFRETMADVLKHERGAGFYCWKPHVVHREMCRLKDGDILVYCDAGNEWISDMRQAIACMDQDILFFSNGWRHLDWCKMDCLDAILAPFYLYLPEIAKGIADAKQVQASTFFIKVAPETRRFIQEWYAWSLMPGIIDNEQSRLPNEPEFREHRWDQSILCCLQIKYRYRLHWFPTTTAGHLERLANDRYPALLWHHRKRNDEW
jgi:hypothetical protein